MLKLMELWDSINLCLLSMNYNSRVQTTKDKIQAAVAILMSREDYIHSLESVDVDMHYRFIEFATPALREIPNGIVDEKIKTAICDGFKDLQVSLAKHFIDTYFNDDIDDILAIPNGDIYLRGVISDSYKGTHDIK